MFGLLKCCLSDIRMSLSYQLKIELMASHHQDFCEFLTCHQKVNSFQRIDDTFHIHVVNPTSEEYSAFVEGIKEAFNISQLRETKLCKAQCRDGTFCLNQANGMDLCSKHF